MKNTLKGFTLFEVLMYLGIFSLMATALMTFSWDVFDLGRKDRASRHVFSDARFVAERLEYLIRNASGVDTSASVYDDVNGRLVLQELGASDTVTIEIRDGSVLLARTGQPDIVLSSLDTQTTELRFLQYGTHADASEYIGFTLGMESVQGGAKKRSADNMVTTLRSGAYIRNSGL